LKRLGVALVFMLIAAACSGTSRTSEAFCEKLEEVTGPEGVEVAFNPGDPARLDGVVSELRSLLDRAPDEIATATSVLLEFFEAYRLAPRGDRNELLAEREASFNTASKQLDDYALTECGLFLQRSVPTPVPTSDPGVVIPPE
jgi:hypothetical protein